MIDNFIQTGKKNGKKRKWMNQQQFFSDLVCGETDEPGKQNKAGLWFLSRREEVFWEEPLMPNIDFEAVVKNTKASKSIFGIRGFSN